MKRLHALWIQVCVNLERAKLWKQWKDQWLPGIGTQGREEEAEHRGDLRQWEYSAPSYNDRYHYTSGQTHRKYNTKSEWNPV